MKVAREETFGPLAPLFRFKSEDEAVLMANDTEFGLAASFYTRDLSRAWRVPEGLASALSGLNTGLTSPAVAHFCGQKDSRLGSERSKYGLPDSGIAPEMSRTFPSS